MEQPAQGRGLALRRHTPQPVQPAIKVVPLTDGAVGELGGQGPVEGPQGLALQLPFQGAIGIGTGSHGLQHRPGNPTGRQALHLGGGGPGSGCRQGRTQGHT